MVFDASVLVSALLRPAGPPGRLLRLLIERRAFELVLSDAIVAELSAALADATVRRHLAVEPAVLDRWATALDLLGSHVVTREDASSDDDKYLAAAAESQAEMIVTTDPQLLRRAAPGPVQIVTPRVFLELLELERERDL